METTTSGGETTATFATLQNLVVLMTVMAIQVSFDRFVLIIVFIIGPAAMVAVWFIVSTLKSFA